jgi:hypothetical protein
MGNDNGVVVVTNSLVFRDVWAAALSQWSQLLLRQSSCLFRRTFSLKRLKAHGLFGDAQVLEGSRIFSSPRRPDRL